MLSDQVMVLSLRERWKSMREDAKEALEIAFRDGITCPCLVPFHFSYTKRSSSMVVEFHHFRIGYATFVIALIDGFPAILWDIQLDDGLPLYLM